MVQKRGEPLLLPLPCCLPYAFPPLWHARPVLCPVRVWLARVSLGPALGSAHSAAGCPALFAGFVATTAGSDFSRPFIIGYGSSPSRRGPARYRGWSDQRS